MNYSVPLFKKSAKNGTKRLNKHCNRHSDRPMCRSINNSRNNHRRQDKQQKEVTMGGWLAALGQQMAGTAAQGAMGILAQRIGKNYDRKQWVKDFEVQAPRLMGMERQQMDYQQQKQLEMWEKTNYAAQVEQMKKAGVNPALLYGQSGGGGMTIGGGMPGAPQVSGTSTGTGNNTVTGMNVLTAAQIKLMDAQARKLNVDADKTAGVDTENVRSDTAVKNQQIQNLIAEAATEKAKKALTEVQTKLSNYEANFLEQTFDKRKQIVDSNANEALGRARQAEAQGEVSYQTYLDIIEGIRVDVANKYLEGALMDAQKNKANQDVIESKTRIKQMEAEIKGLAEEIAQGWHNTITNEERNRIIETLGKWGIAVDGAKKVIDLIVDNLPGGAPKKIKGFGTPGKRY